MENIEKEVGEGFAVAGEDRKCTVNNKADDIAIFGQLQLVPQSQNQSRLNCNCNWHAGLVI